jgi:hypothetical protein
MLHLAACQNTYAQSQFLPQATTRMAVRRFQDNPGKLVAEPHSAVDSISASFQMKDRMPARSDNR